MKTKLRKNKSYIQPQELDIYVRAICIKIWRSFQSLSNLQMLKKCKEFFLSRFFREVEMPKTYWSILAQAKLTRIFPKVHRFPFYCPLLFPAWHTQKKNYDSVYRHS